MLPECLCCVFCGSLSHVCLRTTAGHCVATFCFTRIPEKQATELVLYPACSGVYVCALAIFVEVARSRPSRVVRREVGETTISKIQTVRMDARKTCPWLQAKCHNFNSNQYFAYPFINVSRFGS